MKRRNLKKEYLVNLRDDGRLWRGEVVRKQEAGWY
jgi:hypothetical protein